MFQNPSRQKLHEDWGHNAVFRLPRGNHYKIIVVSDLHFPRTDGHPKYLYEFLQHNSCDTLILLGDTHEGYDVELADFREMNLRVWDLIAARKAQGMKVIDLPGNHDTYKRQPGILEHKAFDTEYWNHIVIDSAYGPTFLFHGDELDGKMISRYDKMAYKVAKKIAVGDKSLVDVYSGLGKLSHYLFGGKDKKTNCVNLEFSAAAMAASHGCSAVLMGHSHKPSSFMPVGGRQDIVYGNTGAWVGGMATAMVMTHDGKWTLVDWAEKRKALFPSKPAGVSAPNLHASFRDATLSEFRWHRAHHAVYAQETLVMKTREALDNVEKIKNRVMEYLHTAEEKLMGSREEVEKINGQAGLKPLNNPKTAQRLRYIA